jgi:hypothetical protein
MMRNIERWRGGSWPALGWTLGWTLGGIRIAQIGASLLGTGISHWTWLWLAGCGWRGVDAANNNPFCLDDANFLLEDRQPLASTRRDQLATAADSGLIVCNGTE